MLVPPELQEMGHQLVQKFNSTTTHILSVPPAFSLPLLPFLAFHSLTPPRVSCVRVVSCRVVSCRVVCVVVARSFDHTAS